MQIPNFEAETPERGYTCLVDSVRRPRTFPRAEVEAAIERYFELANIATKTGDWNAWADLFTEDAIYVEHAFGIVRGREGIRAWVAAATGSRPSELKIVCGRYVIENDLCFVYTPNQKPASDGGRPFQFNAISIFCYAGDGKWCYEEDVYNPLEAKRVREGYEASLQR